LLVAGNHKPSLRTVDEAIRRRFHLVPFDVTIPAEKRDADLPAKLKAEQDGILRWMIDGCWSGSVKGCVRRHRCVMLQPRILRQKTPLPRG
jgi:putative DNA primase/helicase